MEADISELKWVIHDRKAPRLHRRCDSLFAFVGDRQVAAEGLDMAACVECNRSHLLRNRLQGNPCSHRAICSEWPVVLICVRWRMAAAWFFVERLIVVEADAVCTEELCGDAR